MRILAIDYGKKRCGLAVTDPMQIIATQLDTVETKNLIPYLTTYFQKEKVETIVLGKPYRLNNSLNDIYLDIEKLKVALEKKFDKKIEEIDERFTSKLAQQTIIDSGLKKKKRQDKSLVDVVSATIILQNYMDLKCNIKF